MRQKRRKRFPMTSKTTKTAKTTKSNQAQPTANEEPHTTASVAEPGATAASSKAASKKVTSQKKKAAQGRRKATGKATKATKPAKSTASQPRQSRKKTDTPEAPQNPRAPKPESKGAQLLALIGREQGASLAELRQASGWQAHSLRGFISTAGKKHNVKIASSKNEGGDRVYNILR
jgi:hypothetical protein